MQISYVRTQTLDLSIYIISYDHDLLLQVGSKTVKQCVQFYYLWKKICPDDYKRLRLGRRRTRESEFDIDFSKSDIPVSICFKLNQITDV